MKLLRYCKTEVGWRRYPVAIGGNGRLRPNYVMVNGRQREYPEGHYELLYYRGSKAVYENVGPNAAEALAARERKIHLLSAAVDASLAGAKVVEESGRTRLSKQLTRFVTKTEDRGSLVAAKVYRLAGEEFLEIVGKSFADHIKDEDIGLYHRHLRKRGCAERTIVNRHRAVKAFLRDAGVPVHTIMKVSPKAETTLPQIYTPDELKAFFGSLSSHVHVCTFQVLLKLGLRDQEAQFLMWPDVSWHAKTVTIRSKPELGFKIKDREERELGVPSDLLCKLQELRKQRPESRFVLGTAGDNPNSKMLRMLKRLVRRADLHCKNCKGCKERKECEQWYLHKFRSTCATTLLRNGMDLRTVQALMGHSDIETTMRYLRPQEQRSTQALLNAVKWGL